jgi:glucose-1-phosphate cytidylyltransferase
MIKEWFANYFLHNSDVMIDIGKNEIKVLNKNGEDWKVTLIDTGADTMTGGRLKRVAPYIEEDTFMLTYGDGVSDVNMHDLVKFHHEHGKLATLTSVQPAGKFGRLSLDGDKITQFAEKKDNESAWINGGFMVLSKKVVDYISGDDMPFEKDPLENIALDGELMAFKHHGFWFAMDTLQNKMTLESLWSKGEAPWKLWD